MRALPLFVAFFLISSIMGCAGITTPQSLGEENSSFSYIPLDPLPISTSEKIRIFNASKDENSLLNCLPDQAVRIAVGKYNNAGTLVYGPLSIGVEGERYQIVLDYISVDATNMVLNVQKYTVPDPAPLYRLASFPWSVRNSDGYLTNFEIVPNDFEWSEKNVFRNAISDPSAKDPRKSEIRYKPKKITIPVYVGVGLRLTANVAVTKGTANLSSLSAISAAVEAGKLSGSLVVQTLGITGKSISTALPLPSEINQTTIQNAILALGTIKSSLYNANEVTVAPRVVGIYNPVGGGAEFVNGIVSSLASSPPPWNPPCMM